MDPVYSPYHTWACAELWTLDGAYDGPDVRRRRLHGHGFNQARYRVTEFHRVHGFDAVDFTRTHCKFNFSSQDPGPLGIGTMYLNRLEAVLDREDVYGFHTQQQNPLSLSFVLP